MKNIEAIILAAGKGTRMKAEHIPKVLYPLGDRPMLSYILQTLSKIGILHPIIVVGFQAEVVKEEMGPFYRYALQKNQLGTASAVESAKDKVSKEAKAVLVLNGDDSAFYKPETLKKLIESHLNSKAQLTLLTVQLDNPTGLGRIIKDEKGRAVRIVEEKLASEKEKRITEVNTGCYVFEPGFLWQTISKIKKSKAEEYYLTDIVELAYRGNKKINTVKLKNPHEWVGINTPEELEKAEKLMTE